MTEEAPGVDPGLRPLKPTSLGLHEHDVGPRSLGVTDDTLGGAREPWPAPRNSSTASRVSGHRPVGTREPGRRTRNSHARGQNARVGPVRRWPREARVRSDASPATGHHRSGCCALFGSPSQPPRGADRPPSATGRTPSGQRERPDHPSRDETARQVFVALVAELSERHETNTLPSRSRISIR
jgi:hypothetical protein